MTHLNISLTSPCDKTIILHIMFKTEKAKWPGIVQWCTESGCWSPIRPDIGSLFDLDWIPFLFQPDPVIQMK